MTQDRTWSECFAPLEGKRATFNTDGGAWPAGRGHAAIGVAVTSPDNEVVHVEWQYLGNDVSSNEAECRAIIRALGIAKFMGVTAVDIRSDSQMAVRQFNGEWETNGNRFGAFVDTYNRRKEDFQEVTLRWIPREANELANALVSMVRQQDWGVVAPQGIDGRDALARYILQVLEQNGVHVVKYDQGYIHLDEVLIRPLPFYHKENGTTFPSAERTILDEARRNRKPVILAWRPQGMHERPMTRNHIGRMVRDVGQAPDGYVEPLFAFARDVIERLPAGRKRFGYRGSRVFILEGAWRTMREFFWWRQGEVE